MSIDAIGYVRSDISGLYQQADEDQVRDYAKHHGYNLRKMIVFGHRTDDPERRLGVVLARMDDVEAVIVPSVRHFRDGTVPDAIEQRGEVVAVTAPSALTRLIEATR